MTKTLGFIFLAVSVIICLVGLVFLGSGLISGRLETSGAILGLAIVLIVFVLPLGVVGFLTVTKGKQDAKEDAQAANLRKILDVVKTRGTVNLSDLVIELGSTTGGVQDMVYQLVGMGLFNGYVNWDEGKLYSMEASQLNELTLCKNCGGQIKLVGKGVSKCPFCGTEYFLS